METLHINQPKSQLDSPLSKIIGADQHQCSEIDLKPFLSPYLSKNKSGNFILSLLNSAHKNQTKT